MKQKKINKYNLVTIPSFFGILLSIMSLFTNVVEPILDYAWFVVMLITFATIIYGSFLRKN